jgi:hypothetical protein
MGAVGLKSSRWTPERLRQFKGFENFSDEEAERAIETIERLARILLSIHMRNYQENGKSENSSKLREGSKENQEW